MSEKQTGTSKSPLASINFSRVPAAPEHIAHFYKKEEQLIRTLSAFVLEGFTLGESSIVIATPGHEAALRFSLASAGIDVDLAQKEDRYIPLDAEETLSRFMVNGWPDDQRFANLVGEMMKRAMPGKRRTRAFGEMVALLWAQGQTGATVRLEDLWNQFSQSYSFPLLCAYPVTVFTKGPLLFVREICAAHSQSFTRGTTPVSCLLPTVVQAAD